MSRRTAPRGTRQGTNVRLFAAALLAATASVAESQALQICTVLADAATGASLLQKGDCATRVTPASTFKIAISLMGYDSGFLKDAHTPLLSFREGYPDWNAAWRATADPSSWIKNSVVWYSQQVTQSLGEERFQKYVNAFHYGNVDVSGDPGKHNGLTWAWLSSSLRISPLEQTAFLGKVVTGKLAVSSAAFAMTSDILRVGVLDNGWDVFGKIGTGSPLKPDGTHDQAHSYGWFVGWAQKGPRIIVFARLIQDDGQQADSAAGIRARAAFLDELPALLKMQQLAR